MVNLRTKNDKHAHDDEKRRQSINEKHKAKQIQSNIIRQALSSSLNNSLSKKVLFDDDSDNNTEKNTSRKSNEKEKTQLFDGSSSEDENVEFKEKNYFDGKKGLELLNLQSTYGNDERFKIDERFLDEAESKTNGDEAVHEENDNENEEEEEKTKQLKILESVLGHSVTNKSSEKKAKKRTFEMIRYDASNKEHEKYEIKHDTDTPQQSKSRKEGKKSQKKMTEHKSKPQVSKEKFYEVSNDIKVCFKENKEQGGSFSLLQTYGEIDENSANKNEDSEDFGESMQVDMNDEFDEENNEKNCNLSTSISKKHNGTHLPETSDEKKVSGSSAVVKGIWKETFFFVPGDARLKEGLEFINKKDSEEALEAASNYNKTRRKLKEILRLHMKKQLRRNDPFKTKIGGMNKKQLANLKSKKNFSKRKPPKV